MGLNGFGFQGFGYRVLGSKGPTKHLGPPFFGYSDPYVYDSGFRSICRACRICSGSWLGFRVQATVSGLAHWTPNANGVFLRLTL